MMPVSPPNRNVTRKPIAHSIGVSNVMLPRHIVPTQLKNFTPVGTAMRNVMKEKNGSSTAPVTNMWCAHTAIDSAAIVIVANTRPLVAEDRLAAEHRQDLGDDAEERQRDDVDLGMAEEPEQVLPQDRPAVLGVEDVRAELSVGEQRQQRGGSTGNAISTRIAVSRMFQVKIGIRNIVMPGARMVKIVVMKLTPPRMVPRPAERQAHDPQVGARARGVDLVGQRRVRGPAEGRRATRGEEAGRRRSARRTGTASS